MLFNATGLILPNKLKVMNIYIYTYGICIWTLVCGITYYICIHYISYLS